MRKQPPAISTSQIANRCQRSKVRYHISVTDHRRGQQKRLCGDQSQETESAHETSAGDGTGPGTVTVVSWSSGSAFIVSGIITITTAAAVITGLLGVGSSSSVGDFGEHGGMSNGALEGLGFISDGGDDLVGADGGGSGDLYDIR